MTQPADVRIKLVVDDHSSATVEKVRSGLAGVSNEAHKAGEPGGLSAGMGMFSGAALAGVAAVGLIGVGLHEAYESAKMLGEAAVEAAEGEAKQIKAMAGVLMLIDGGVNSMKDLKTYAASVHAELEDTAVAMGIPADKMDDAFNTLMERGGIASERAKELTIDMAMVGKVTRGGMDGLAAGFSMIEMGVVRARNPIVGLIAATQTLKGNAHAVAEQMQKMTPERQMELAQQAIEKQAEAMRKSGSGQLSLGAVKQSLTGMREQFMEAMGAPMLDALLPPLNRVQKYLLEHIEKIQEWGTKIGNAFTHVINAVVSASTGIYNGIVLSWDRIQTSFDQIFGSWVKAWDTALGDTDSIEKKFASFTEDLILAFELGAKIMKATAEVFMDANDLLHGNAAGTSTTAIQEKAMTHDVTQAYGAGGAAQFDKEAEKYRQMAIAAGQNADAVDEWIGKSRVAHDINMKAADDAQQSLNGGDHSAFNTFLDNAIKGSNEGAEKFAFSMLHGSATAAQALIDASKNIGGGMEEMMKIVSNLDPVLAAQIKKLQNPIGAAGGVKAPTSINNHFSGAINIKQDFRDQDPDRIALVFKNDVARKSLARTSARTSSIFGL